MVGGGLYGVYSFGSKNGKQEVQANWDAAIVVHENQIKDLKLFYSRREADHRDTNKQISFELSSAKEKYQLDVAAVERQFSKRLRNSEDRASVYERQAAAGEAQCRDLAGHAAKLDRSLEEGRQVVGELQATIRLRDDQLIMLGKKINSDYELQKD